MKENTWGYSLLLFPYDIEGVTRWIGKAQNLADFRNGARLNPVRFLDLFQVREEYYLGLEREHETIVKDARAYFREAVITTLGISANSRERISAEVGIPYYPPEGGADIRFYNASSIDEMFDGSVPFAVRPTDGGWYVAEHGNKMFRGIFTPSFNFLYGAQVHYKRGSRIPEQFESFMSEFSKNIFAPIGMWFDVPNEDVAALVKQIEADELIKKQQLLVGVDIVPESYQAPPKISFAFSGA